jgi:hypothetical protein
VRATIVVITAPGHPTLLESEYVVRHVAEHWHKRGVRFVLTIGPDAAPAGDIAWQHLDVTRVAPAYQRLVASYPAAINAGAADVHKRRTATHLVTRDDDWPGPVIVKTDRNYGGRPEDWAYRWRPLRHPWFHRIRDRMPSRITGRIDPLAYPIYPSKAGVPAWMWRDRRFVVQRFLSERKGDLYGIRRWFFLGENEFAYLSHGPDAIVSGDNHSSWEQLPGPPASVRTLRAELALDFGKIDYAEVDGEVVIYDVNAAVSADGPAGSGLQQEIVDALVPGLESLLVRAGR